MWRQVKFSILAGLVSLVAFLSSCGDLGVGVDPNRRPRGSEVIDLNGLSTGGDLNGNDTGDGGGDGNGGNGGSGGSGGASDPYFSSDEFDRSNGCFYLGTDPIRRRSDGVDLYEAFCAYGERHANIESCRGRFGSWLWICPLRRNLEGQPVLGTWLCCGPV